MAFKLHNVAFLIKSSGRPNPVTISVPLSICGKVYPAGTVIYIADPMSGEESLRSGKQSNHKLNGATSWSLTPVLSCPGAKKAGCVEGCFGKAGRLGMDAAQDKAAITFQLAKQNDGQLEALINKQFARIAKKGLFCDVRIHVMGDFFSQKYVDLVARICAANPRFNFFALSKSLHLFDFSELQTLPNVQLTDSIGLNGKKNFYPQGSEEYESYKLAAQAEWGDDFRECPYPAGGLGGCGVGCRFCIDHAGTIHHVLIAEHSARLKPVNLWPAKAIPIISEK